MKIPIIAFEGLDLDLYESVDRAEKDFEPTDVRNQEYIIFDANGHRLDCVIELGRGTFGGQVETVRLTHVAGSDLFGDQTDLKNRLVAWLTMHDETVDDDTPLRDLIAKVAALHPAVR